MLLVLWWRVRLFCIILFSLFVLVVCVLFGWCMVCCWVVNWSMLIVVCWYMFLVVDRCWNEIGVGVVVDDFW